MPDQHRNFAYSTIATPPSPASSGTSLIVQPGQGALFPTPPFNATIWPTGVLALASNAEIVRVTAVAADTFTILRAQEGSSARGVLAGDQIGGLLTVKSLGDVEGPLISPFTGQQATVIQDGVAGVAIDAISSDRVNKRVLYSCVGAVTQVRYYDVVSGVDALIASDNLNDSHTLNAAQAAIDGSDRVAYPTAAKTVKVVTYAGALISETPVFTNNVRALAWQQDAAFAVTRLLAYGSGGNAGVDGPGIYLIDPATGASSLIISVATVAGIAFTAESTRNIVYFDNGVLTVASPTGATPTPVAGAPVADTSIVCAPRLVDASGAAGQQRWAYLTADGRIVNIAENGTGLITIASDAVGAIKNPIATIPAGNTNVIYRRTRFVPTLSEIWISRGDVADNGTKVTPVTGSGTLCYSPVVTADVGPIHLAFGYDAPDAIDRVAVMQIGDV